LSKDIVIIGEIKSKLFVSEDINKNSVKIVTVNKIIYVFGIIPKEQLKKYDRCSQ